MELGGEGLEIGSSQTLECLPSADHDDDNGVGDDNDNEVFLIGHDIAIIIMIIKINEVIKIIIIIIAVMMSGPDSQGIFS